MALTVCREHGPSRCACHPDATHKHYSARTGWRTYTGHAHSVLVNSDGRTTRCYHDGCDYRGTVGLPVIVRRA